MLPTFYFTERGVTVLISFVLKLTAQINKAKEKAKVKQLETYKKLQRNEKFKALEKGGAKTDLSDLDDKNSKSIKKLQKEVNSEKLKSILLLTLSYIIGFFESLPLYITIFLSVLALVVVIGVIVMIVSMIVALQGLVGAGNETNKPQIKPPSESLGNQQGGSGAIWTLDELAKRGGLLTDYEKNLYRLVMLCYQTATGELTGQKIDGDPESTASYLVGIASIETGMAFYDNLPKSSNILEIPSDRVENSLGYGVFGLSKNDTLGNYYGASSVTQIKSMYTPKTTPVYPIRFYPYAVPMGTKHLLGKMESLVFVSDTQAKINAVMDDFGITENREELKTIIEWCLGKAQYHGALKSEHEAYITYWCAMWLASSDDPAKMNLSNYTYQNSGYDESGIRHLYTGIYHNTSHSGKTYNHINQIGNPSNLTYCPKCSSRVYLNGSDIGKPVLGFIWDKYGNSSNAKIKSRMSAMWQQMNTICGYTSGAKDRILNFHYGVNAYIQGKKVIADVSGKLTGTPEGEESGTGSYEPTGEKQTDMINYAKAIMKDGWVKYNTDAKGNPLDGKGGRALSVKQLGPVYYHMISGTTIHEKADGTFEGSVDCSAYVQFIYKKFGVSLPRNSNAQYNSCSIGTKMGKTFDLQPTDLLFFSASYDAGKITHVAMYIGNNEFIHAYNDNCPLGISKLKGNSYYESRFMGARRISIP